MARLNAIRNLHPLDRSLRAVIGAVVLATAWTTGEIGVWAVVTTAVGFYLLITAGFGWDPLYTALHFRTEPEERARQGGAYCHDKKPLARGTSGGTRTTEEIRRGA